jgi:hypothetical protein
VSGAAYAAFRSALASGSLDRIRRTARQLPEVRLEDALAICVAYRDEPDLYERAAMRWLGRFCLEARGATLEDVYQVAEALERLPDSPHQTAAELAKLISRR